MKIKEWFFRRIGYPKTAAVILAAGSGTRMKGKDATAKQFLPLCGEPILVHTLRAFSACARVDEIVIVTRKEDTAYVANLLRKYDFRKVTCVVSGGDTRQESARKGFEAVSPSAKYVAFHDACRCLIRSGEIAAVIRDAILYGVACAGTPAVDTLKKVGPSGFVKETPDRSEYWQAQTPQVFRASLYRAAAYTAEKGGYLATDDTALAEKIGQRVRMVDCGRENIKVTFPSDLAVAAAILAERNNAEEEKS